jgi:hypothetical protein
MAQVVDSLTNMYEWSWVRSLVNLLPKNGPVTGQVAELEKHQDINLICKVLQLSGL